jgi:hypothetical protein
MRRRRRGGQRAKMMRDWRGLNVSLLRNHKAASNNLTHINGFEEPDALGQLLFSLF